MIEIRYICPVRFPENWQRTAPKAAVIDQNFAKNISVESALKYLQEELDHARAHKAVLYSNFDNLHNERSRSKKGHSEGVTLEISVGDTTAHIACDKWYHIQQNIYALHLAVRHLRLFEDWGIATAEFMMTPFAVQARPDATHNHGDESDEHNRRSLDAPWRRLLGLGETATLDDANAVYRSRAKKVADDEDALIELNKAIEIARQNL
jgi:hypothetical protein